MSCNADEIGQAQSNVHGRSKEEKKRPLFETQLRDGVKAHKVRVAGLKMIRVYQPDVWRDRKDWDVKLKEAIEALPFEETKRTKEKRLRCDAVCEPAIVDDSKRLVSCKKPKTF